MKSVSEIEWEYFTMPNLDKSRITAKNWNPAKIFKNSCFRSICYSNCRYRFVIERNGAYLPLVFIYTTTMENSLHWPAKMQFNTNKTMNMYNFNHQWQLRRRNSYMYWGGLLISKPVDQSILRGYALPLLWSRTSAWTTFQWNEPELIILNYRLPTWAVGNEFNYTTICRSGRSTQRSLLVASKCNIIVDPFLGLLLLHWWHPTKTKDY